MNGRNGMYDGDGVDEFDGFEPPGPGGWKALADHFPRALTPEYQRLYAETCPQGMASYMSRYGVLARTLDVAFVQGHVYIAPVPLAGPREMRRTPPSSVVWLMARLHPEFRRRTRAARRALAERPWRTVAAHWFDTERQHWRNRSLQLQAIEPGGLTDVELVEHLRSARRFVVEGYGRHFELHGDDLLPIGLLIARGAEWGIDAAAVMRLLTGESSHGYRLAAPEGWQLATGYDLDDLTWHELGTTPSPIAGTDAARVDLDRMAERMVPDEHRDEFRELVDDARAAVPLRDDNGVLTGAWPMGLLRRAMLESGRRLTLAEPGLAVEATVDELIERLERTGGPTDDELARRRVDRRRRSCLDAPSALGPEFAIPPLDALPRPLALIGAAQLAAADHMLEGPEPVGIGTRSHTGRALVVRDPTDALDLIEPGDVVITQATSPAWNAILVHAGAVVTTSGGQVSHAAVIARQLDIPAVIGNPAATSRFSTGDTVVVDPKRADVRLAGQPNSDIDDTGVRACPQSP